jgi:hypothetical protein
MAGMGRPEAAIRSVRSTAAGDRQASHRPPSAANDFWGAK